MKIVKIMTMLLLMLSFTFGSGWDWDGKTLRLDRVSMYKLDGNRLSCAKTYKKLYRFSDGRIKNEMYTTILKVDASYISDPQTYRKLYKWKGMKLYDYNTGKYVGDFSGWNRYVVALLVTGYL